MNPALPGMPELPECDSYCTHKDSHEYDVWNANQMHAFYLQGVAAGRAEASKDAGWRDIETAPKGVLLLLAVPTRYKKWLSTVPLAGMWFGTHWGTMNADEAIQRVDPTHWQPLPQAPIPPAATPTKEQT